MLTLSVLLSSPLGLYIEDHFPMSFLGFVFLLFEQTPHIWWKTDTGVSPIFQSWNLWKSGDATLTSVVLNRIHLKSDQSLEREKHRFLSIVTYYWARFVFVKYTSNWEVMAAEFFVLLNLFHHHKPFTKTSLSLFLDTFQINGWHSCIESILRKETNVLTWMLSEVDCPAMV